MHSDHPGLPASITTEMVQCHGLVALCSRPLKPVNSHQKNQEPYSRNCEIVVVAFSLVPISHAIHGPAQTLPLLLH